MKKEFELDDTIKIVGCINIIGKEPKNKPYLAFSINSKVAFMKDQDIERFAVNILKVLKSKKLK